jgi:hypothetical protein
MMLQKEPTDQLTQAAMIFRTFFTMNISKLLIMALLVLILLLRP